MSSRLHHSKQKNLGIVLTHKPAGLLSNTCVQKLKHILHQKIGHSGTLDQFASGLMLLLVGKATGFSSFFLNAEKSYRASFFFGKSTDTLDSKGVIQKEISKEQAITFLKTHKEEITHFIHNWVGTLEQVPPIYSALKKNGKRLSDYARHANISQEDLEKMRLAKKREIQVYEAKVNDISFENTSCDVFFRVSSGTYIRSFAERLENTFQIPVHLQSLQRVSIEHEQKIAMHEEPWKKYIWHPQKEDNPPALLAIDNFLYKKWPQFTIPLTNAEYLKKNLKNGILVDPSEFQNTLSHEKKFEELKTSSNFLIKDQEGIFWCWG